MVENPVWCNSTLHVGDPCLLRIAAPEIGDADKSNATIFTVCSQPSCFSFLSSSIPNCDDHPIEIDPSYAAPELQSRLHFDSSQQTIWFFRTSFDVFRTTFWRIFSDVFSEIWFVFQDSSYMCSKFLRMWNCAKFSMDISEFFLWKFFEVNKFYSVLIRNSTLKIWRFRWVTLNWKTDFFHDFPEFFDLF